MEARIAVKVVANRFVTCWPMPAPEQTTFRQSLIHSHLMGHANRRDDQSGWQELAIRMLEDSAQC